MTLSTSENGDGAAASDSQETQPDRITATAARVQADRAERIVTDLIETGYVDPLPELQRFVHRPTNERFRSPIRLAAYHAGWIAGRSD